MVVATRILKPFSLNPTIIFYLIVLEVRLLFKKKRIASMGYNSLESIALPRYSVRQRVDIRNTDETLVYGARFEACTV